ncbi:hypothetical protein Cycma_3874 [Cyclobacterium marinum DSM 745]|uniref:Uncharacterized protein n=1 Tax=Cyclobacterium marinum (strain ATCC 25205 / DSM 745 / LMG 13164 / NCIMB 1802) TaxID=880070 RepID=G0J5E7_CYCMS|nr:hypothetical protein Cycma_3874 [Cyclobacterium marinum DSM 745]|tara:strand:- start:43474 stop:43722 length:249 start_codon:yes stop_codon:yes gene_type:complete
MEKLKNRNAFYIGGLVAILLASYFSWTIFFLFLSLILYPTGVILVLLSKKKWWIKLVTISLPLIFTLPTGPMIINFFEGLFS